MRANPYTLLIFDTGSLSHMVGLPKSKLSYMSMVSADITKVLG